ncbi:uncharacterized protein LOC134826111 [Bolinopsis microptera]|uniref:uncharacterized protein LOC134813164 n=1 Tax=Bolinopsis microptera TaxID=2820187 RepID=UPI0030799899
MPDAMDSTTSKRYEGKIPWVQRSQPAVRRQQCRILDDQKNAAMVADNVECEKTSLFANWKEKDQHEQKSLEDNYKTINKETQAVKTARLAVRRELLANKLEEEDRQCQSELQAKGLAQFKERR